MSLLERRRAILGAKGNSIDWESIARGMCDGVTEFSIPSSVTISTNIANGMANRNIVSVDISEGNTLINIYYFASCLKLVNVTFPSTLTTLNNNCFQGCRGLTTITLPSTITTYGSGVFFGCLALKEVIVEAVTPPTAGTNLFQSCTALTAIYVPDASVSAYQSASGWSTYASIIKGISERP